MRLPRLVQRGVPAAYHCMSRTVAGQHLFGPRERRAFCRRLRRLARFLQIRIHSHTILSNHFHLVLQVPPTVQLSDAQLLEALEEFYGPQHPNCAQFARALQHPHSPLLELLRRSYLARMGDLSLFMKELKEGFSKWFNAVHERFGTLWAERFKSVLLPVLRGVLLTLCAYVDLNAVRACLVRRPQDYPYCGWAQAREGPGPAREGLAELLPGRTWAEKARSYEAFLQMQGSRARHSGQGLYLPEQAWERLQHGQPLSLAEALHLKVRALSEGIALGSAPFVEALFQNHRRRFCRKRTQGAFPLQGAPWHGLTSMKKFKQTFEKPAGAYDTTK